MVVPLSDSRASFAPRVPADVWVARKPPGFAFVKVRHHTAIPV